MDQREFEELSSLNTAALGGIIQMALALAEQGFLSPKHVENIAAAFTAATDGGGEPATAMQAIIDKNLSWQFAAIRNVAHANWKGGEPSHEGDRPPA